METRLISGRLTVRTPGLTSPRRHRRSLLACALSLAVAMAATAGVARAGTIYWDGSGTSMNALGSWSMSSTLATPDPGALPGSTDDVIFSSQTVTSGQTGITMNAGMAVQSLSFNVNATTGLAYTISSTSSTGRTLTIGSGGVQVAAGLGVVTIGNAGASVFPRLDVSQTWTNNSSSVLSIRNSLTGSATAAGPVVWTVNCAGSGNIADSGTLGDGNTAVSLVVASTGTGSVTFGSGNTYTGGTTVKSGTLTATGFGTGSMLLGDTAGTLNATLNVSTATTIANDITVQAGSSSNTLTLTNGASSVTSFTGAITLNHDLTVTPGTTAGTITFSSTVSGAGNLTKAGLTLVLSGANTYTGATSITTGTLRVASINSVSGGTATSNMGAPTAGNGTIAIGSVGAGTLLYTGAGEITDRAIDLAGTTTGATIDQSGTGLLKFTSAFTATGVGNKTLTLQGSTAGTGQISNAIVDNLTGTNTTGVTKAGTGTWTLSGASSYTGTTTVNGGTLLLDMNAGASLNSASALTLGGGTLNVKGASGGSSQTFGAFVLTAGTNNIISLDPNNGTGVTVTLGNAWTRGAGTSMLFDYSSSNTGTRAVVTAGATTSATLSNGIYGWALVKDSSGVVGFATRAAGTDVAITRYDDTTGTTLTDSSATSAANYTTLASTYTGLGGNQGGTLTWTNSGTLGNRTINSLTIDTTNNYGTIDMGIATNVLTLNSLGILFKGANNETLTGGRVGASGGEVIVHQTGSGVLTINSLIGAAASRLTKDGTGVLVVGANNTYTGSTNINAGTLRLGAAGDGTSTPLGTTAGTTFVASGGALDLNGITLSTNEGLTLNGTGVSGGGALTNSSSTAATYGGLLVLSGHSSVVASSGNIILSNAGTISGSGWGLTLDGTASGSSLASIIGTGTGTLTKNGTGTWTLSGVNTYTGATSVTGGTLKAGVATSAFGNNSAVTLANTGGVTLDITGFSTQLGSLTGGGATGGNVTLGAATLTVGADNTSPAAYAGIISGTGGVTKTGSGTWIVSGANSYSGATTVSAGTLKLGVAGDATNSPLGTSATGTTVSSGGALDLNGYTLLFDEALTLSGSGVANGALTNSSSTAVTYSGLVTLGAASTIAASTGNIAITNAGTITGATFGLTLDGAANGSIASIIATTTGTLTKNGAGIWTLSGANTYTGATSVTGGTLRAGVATVAGTSGAFGKNSAVTLANTIGAVMDLAGFDTQLGSLTGGGASGGNVTLGAGTLTAGADNTSPAAYAGVVSGTGGVVKIGTGTWIVSGANTYSGATAIMAGTLSVGSLNKVIGGTASSNLGTPITVANGTIAIGATAAGTLIYTGTGETTDRVLDLAGATTGATLDQSGTGLLRFSSALTASGAGSKSLTLQGSTAGTGEIGGAIIDNSTTNKTSLTKTGTGTWTLSAANSYSGGTTISGGTLKLSGTGTLGAISNALTMSGTSTLDLNATDQTVSSLTGATTNNVVNNRSSAGTNTLTVSGSTSSTWAGVIADNSISGSGLTALTKAGSSTLILTGANTYTGATTVNGGILQLNLATGSLGSTSNLAMGGGTLTINGSASLGQTLGNVTMNNGPMSAIVVTAATSTTLTLGDTWTRNAGGTLYLNPSSATAGLIHTNNAPSSMVNGIIPGAFVSVTGASTDSGLVTRDGSGNLVLYAGASEIATNSDSATTNFKFSAVAAGGTLTHNSGNWAVSSLLMSDGNSNETLNLGGGVVTITSGTIARNGGGAMTISNGQLGVSGTEVVLVQRSVNNALTISATISGDDNSVPASPVLGRFTISTPVPNAEAFNNGVILTGANTYTGGTVIGAGRLQIGNGATGSILGDVANFGTLAFGRSNAYTFSGIISGTGNIEQGGTGTLTLTGNNSYTGKTTILNGILEVSSINSTTGGTATSNLGAPAAGNGGLSLATNGNATLRYIGSGETTDRLISIASGSGRRSTIDSSGSTGALIFSNTGVITMSNTSSGNTSVFELTGTNTANNTIAGAIVAGNVLSGGTSVLKSGVGTWMLTNDLSRYNNATTISAGTLIAGGDSINKLTPAGAQTGQALSSIDSTADTFTITGNTLVTGDRIFFTQFTGTGSGGITASATAPTAYYVTNVSGDTFQVATTLANAQTGTFVNFSGTALTGNVWQLGAFGSASSAIALGDANTLAGSAPKLLVGNAGAGFTTNRPITLTTSVLAGPAGATYTIGGNTDANNTFAGLITANKNLTVSQVTTTGANALNVTGGITGSTVASNPTTVSFAGPGKTVVAGTPISDGTGSALSVAVTGGNINFATTNTYTGTTTVSAGILDVTGSTDGTTGLSIANGAQAFFTNGLRNAAATVSIATGGQVTMRETSPNLGGGWPGGAGAAVSVLGGLTLTGTAKLDLYNNDLVIDYSGDIGTLFTDINEAVRSGYAGGAWNGSGINSTTAGQLNYFTLLVLDTADTNDAYNPGGGGPTVDATSVVVKFTHQDDLDGNGSIDATDKSIFTSHWSDGGTGATHRFGDMDFDGVYTFNDVQLFNLYYNTALPSLPEPGSLALLALGAAGLLARKRR